MIVIVFPRFGFHFVCVSASRLGNYDACALICDFAAAAAAAAASQAGVGGCGGRGATSPPPHPPPPAPHNLAAVMSELLDAAETKSMQTPLMMASRCGHAAVVRLLAERGDLFCLRT
jgi:hypothetical protein